jgi:D-Tyr-tRNAtyr deacylase
MGFSFGEEGSRVRVQVSGFRVQGKAVYSSQLTVYSRKTRGQRSGFREKQVQL